VPPVFGLFPARFAVSQAELGGIPRGKIIFYVFFSHFDEFPVGISLKNLK